MNTEEEIRSLFSRLKITLDANREIGLEPPYIPSTDNGSVSTPSPLHAKTPAEPYPDSLDSLAVQLDDCKRCKLHTGRNCVVFGEGAHDAELVFVGEGPGREEDLEGRPFVGEAGKLLTKIIENGMGIRRENVYICNVVKCRPPNNREPQDDEIKNCIPFLKQQIRVLKPKAICALGRVAGQALLGGEFKISRDRGKWFSYMGIPLIATFHPAYLLRNPGARRQVWDDIKQVMKQLGLEVKKNG